MKPSSFVSNFIKRNKLWFHRVSCDTHLFRGFIWHSCSTKCDDKSTSGFQILSGKYSIGIHINNKNNYTNQVSSGNQYNIAHSLRCTSNILVPFVLLFNDPYLDYLYIYYIANRVSNIKFCLRILQFITYIELLII